MESLETKFEKAYYSYSTELETLFQRGIVKVRDLKGMDLRDKYNSLLHNYRSSVHPYLSTLEDMLQKLKHQTQVTNPKYYEIILDDNVQACELFVQKYNRLLNDIDNSLETETTFTFNESGDGFYL